MKCHDKQLLAEEQRFSIGVSQFRNALQQYPELDREALEWVWGYLYQVIGGNAQTLIRELGVPYGDIHRVFCGRPTDQYSAVLAGIADLRRRAAKRQPLVETEVTRKIVEGLDYARDYAAMVAIVGSTGRGKTYTAEHWAAQNNHGRTRMIRAGSGTSRTALLIKLCEAIGCGWSGYRSNALEQRVISSGAYGPRNVLIVDEAGHLIPKGDSNGTGAIEFLRDLYDSTGCAIVLILTDVYLEQMTLGRMNRFFEQFRGRLEKVVRLDENPSVEEVEAAVRSFSATAADDLIAVAYKAACDGDGKLRTLYRDLQKAYLLAKAEERDIETDDLQTAIAWRRGER